jgi:hypothetical protein
MRRALERVGLTVLAVECATVDAADLTRPCILIERPTPPETVGHAFVCYGGDESTVVVGDYPRPPVRVPKSRLRGNITSFIYAEPSDGSFVSGLKRQLWFQRNRMPLLLIVGTAMVCFVLPVRPLARVLKGRKR